MQFGNKSARNEQIGKRLLKYCFFKKKKRIKFELIRNSTHQINSLRESFIPQLRAIEAFYCPEYVIRLHKEQKVQAKTKNLREKICTKTMSPQSFKY